MAESKNPVVWNAMAATNRMSAQQAITQVEMLIGSGDEDTLWMLMDEYGPQMRSALGEAKWRDLQRRAYAS